MGTMPQLIEIGQTINYMVQIPFKPGFPNLVFQILKVGILVDGFKNVIDLLKSMESRIMRRYDWIHYT